MPELRPTDSDQAAVPVVFHFVQPTVARWYLIHQGGELHRPESRDGRTWGSF